MLIYLLVFAIIALFAYTTNNSKKSFFPFFLLCMALGLFVGLGDMLGGYDRYIYGEVFTTMANSEHISWIDAFTLNLGIFKTEVGYGLWNLFIGMFTPNRYIFILATTLLIYALLAVNLYRAMRNPYFGLMLFMGLWFFFSFTYLRQVLAVNIVWLAIPYVWERKLIKFSALILLGAMFHNSAILFGLLYFMPQRKYDFRIVLIGMMVALAVGLVNISSVLYSTYGDIVEQAGARAQNYQESAVGSLNIAYVLESFFFIFILFINYYKINFKDKKITVYTNIYMLFCFILLLFIRNSDGGRLAWYFMIGLFSILTYLIQLPNSQMFKSLLGVVSFLMYYRILSLWAFNMTPYKTFLTPGHTAAEWIYQMYEYDQNYDNDKLYNL